MYRIKVCLNQTKAIQGKVIGNLIWLNCLKQAKYKKQENCFAELFAQKKWKKFILMVVWILDILT